MQYLAYFVMAALLTVLTSNDVVILTLTPVIYHFSKATGIDPAPLLFLEFFTANVWSMALLIGGSAAHLWMRLCTEGVVVARGYLLLQRRLLLPSLPPPLSHKAPYLPSTATVSGSDWYAGL